ncbi:MBL fold metallo-hydrolase [Luteimonas galliterrae]|nr:MBL fold metallo-hydrolase [Luteimonas galliterrae]
MRERLSRRDFLGGLAAAAALSAMPLAPAAASPTLRAQRLAWAGVRLQLDTATLFLDPLLNPDVWGAALEDPLIPVSVDKGDRYVLATHRHPDHCDPVAIRQALGANGTLLMAASAGSPFGGDFRTRLAPLYEPQVLGDFTATAVPAADGYGDVQVSWIVSGGGRRIIHCGDTLWHGAWWQIGRQYGPFDAAFLPINGAKFAWRKPVSDIHAVLTPEEAVAAAVVMGARQIVPIHYGVDGAEGYQELPDVEASLTRIAAKRGVGVEIRRPGEWLEWTPNR